MTSPEEFVLLLQSESGWYQLAQDNTDSAELGELLLRGRVELVGKKIQVRREPDRRRAVRCAVDLSPRRAVEDGTLEVE